MSSKNRVSATMQLNKTYDLDLVEWYQSIPDGDRNRELKRVVRCGLGLQPLEAAGSFISTSPAIDAQQLETLRAEMYQEWAKWTRQLVESLPGYVQEAVSRAIQAPVVPMEEVVQETNRLTQAEAETRKSKLKKAAW